MASSLNFQALQQKFESVLEDKKLLLMLFGGFFLLESVLSLWTGNAYDMDVWFKTGNWITHGVNIYLPLDHLGYPPVWALWCGATYDFYMALGVNYTIWRFLIKLPMIIAHLVLAYEMGKFAQRHFTKKKAAQTFFFILTWNFFFFVGPIWGQINTISVLMTFLGFAAIVENHTAKSGIYLGMAAALKIFPIVTLPAFLVYTLKNRGKFETLKLLIYTVAVPVILTAAIFLVFNWDLLYFVRTVLYSTPTLENNPTQITIGCMNIWSYIATLNIDLSWQWPFRMMWIALIGLFTVYWLRKPRLDEAGLLVASLSFYLVFMATYGWVTEQTFLDILPFTFLLFFLYKPKRVYLYLLGALQVLVYGFAVANLNLHVFEPLIWKIYYPLGTAVHNLYDFNGPLVWTFRAYLGLAVTVALLLFLVAIMKPTVFTAAAGRFKKLVSRAQNRTKPKS